jgi:hypothetical protein
MNEKFANLFAEFAQVNNLKMIEDERPLDVYYGRNEDGRLCIAVVSKFSSLLPKPTKAMEFIQRKIGQEYWTYISLLDESAKSTFFWFCDDLLQTIDAAADDKAAFQGILDRIAIWKKMFSSRGGLLSEKVIQGLFGELVFLDEYMIPKYGKEKAVKAWGGPLGLPKDYTIALDWFEVKCILATDYSVTISSHEQLLSSNPGHLVVIKVEKMPEAFNNGISNVNLIFSKIGKELNDMPEILEDFFAKVRKIGYWPDDAYDNYRYKIVDKSFYSVSEGFPRITSPSSFGDAFGKISYELLLNAIQKFTEGDQEWTKKN